MFSHADNASDLQCACHPCCRRSTQCITCRRELTLCRYASVCGCVCESGPLPLQLLHLPLCCLLRERAPDIPQTATGFMWCPDLGLDFQRLWRQAGYCVPVVDGRGGRQ